MTLPASEGFSEAVTEGHNYARQLFLCYPDGTIIQELPVGETTSIDVGAGLVRRSGNIVLPNGGQDYWPTEGGLIDFGRAYLLRFTVQTDDGDLSCDQPLLYPDTDESDVAGDTVVPVSDGMRIVADDAELAMPLSFLDGAPLEEVVRGLLVACGAPDDDAYYDLQSEGEYVNGLHGYEIGTRVADTLSTLLTDHVCELWAAPPNIYKLRPTPDPLTDDAVATWGVGRDIRMISLNQKRTQAAKNHALVSGVDRTGRPFTVDVKDLNPLSPVMYGKLGVGDLVVKHQSDGIRDPYQAERIGRQLLARYSTIRDFTTMVPGNPAQDFHDVIRIIDTERGIDTQGLLGTFSLPAAPGAQQYSLREGRALE